MLRVLLLLQQGPLRQVLFVVQFIVVLDVTEDRYFINIVVAKLHHLSMLCSTLLTMHVCSLRMTPCCTWKRFGWTLASFAMCKLFVLYILMLSPWVCLLLILQFLQLGAYVLHWGCPCCCCCYSLRIRTFPLPTPSIVYTFHIPDGRWMAWSLDPHLASPLKESMGCFLDPFCHRDQSPSQIVLLQQCQVDPVAVVEVHVEQSAAGQLWGPSMCPALSSQLVLGLRTIPFVNEMEGLRIVSILLWIWNSSLDSFPDTIHLPPPFDAPIDACINYLGHVEVGQSPYKMVAGPNCIAQRICIKLPHYSFVRVLLCCLLLCCSVSASSILVRSPHHVALSLVTFDQCHDVTRVGRIHGDAMLFLFEVFKYDVIEVDSLLKGCSVLMLELQCEDTVYDGRTGA